MPDISLLPEELRKREEELKNKEIQQSKAAESLKMHVPNHEDEDVEIIEIDEGEIGDVLKNEPLISRYVFRAHSLFEELKTAIFHSKAAEPPPKLPPQFFSTPSLKEKKPPGLVPTSPPLTPPPAPEEHPPLAERGGEPEASVPPHYEGGARGGSVEKSKARIVPHVQAPRRVRVIRRVRKPVRVSFLDDDAMRLSIDLPRRRFTLVVFASVFALLFAGSFIILDQQGDRAALNAETVNSQLADVQNRIKDKQKDWSSFQDLEPRLKALGGVLDGHLMPTMIFDALEKATVPDVFYSSFTLLPEGRLTLAVTAPSFESAARQVVALRESAIASSVESLGFHASYEKDTVKVERVNFQVNIDLKPDVTKALEILSSAPK
jgi:Tfp pilus assembly protein PilN